MNRLVPVLLAFAALCFAAFSSSATYGQERSIQYPKQHHLAQFSLPWFTEEKKSAPEKKTPPTPTPKTQTAPAPSTPTQAPAAPPSITPKTQQATPAPTTPAQESKPTAVAGPGWAVNCRSKAGEKALSCRMSQTVIAQKSGRTLADVAFLLGSDSKATEVVLQLPLGLYLPAGASYQVDENTPQSLKIRTCTRNGCYARGPVSTDVIGALRKGKQLKVAFKDQAENPVTVPLSLEGFAVAYEKIPVR